jgi:two-component system, NtrC family, response regulator HydG
VFLDEISDISLRVQTDLLRVLQEKEIVRVGDTLPVKVDFRAIAATNKSLEKLVDERLFRPDLYYRLNVFTIEIPPLRARREDIPLLADHFLAKLATHMNRPPQRLSAKALEVLMDHQWPGNVRELENCIERAMLIDREPELKPEDFPFQAGSARNSSLGGQRLEDIEKIHIERMLEETNWNLSRTARILDIDRTTLYNKIKRYGLREPAEK